MENCIQFDITTNEKEKKFSDENIPLPCSLFWASWCYSWHRFDEKFIQEDTYHMRVYKKNKKVQISFIEEGFFHINTLILL